MTEYGPLLQILTNRRKSRQVNTDNILSQCQKDQRESHAHCPGTNPGPCDAKSPIRPQTVPHLTEPQPQTHIFKYAICNFYTALTFFILYCKYSQNRYHLSAVFGSLLYFAKCSRNPKKCAKYHSIRTSKIMQTQTHNKILQDG